MPDLLVEIGMEEIPAAYLDEALAQMEKIVPELLSDARLSYEKVNYYGTPRRLVLAVEGLPAQQATLTKEVLGPRENVAFTPDGKPTEALNGFAKRYQTAPQEVKLRETDKGKVCCLVITTKGEKTEAIMARLIPTLLGKISFPKSMWWLLGKSPDLADKTLTFARPIRYIAALFGKKTLKVALRDIPCTNKTYGHHLLKPKPITLTSADFNQYQKRLAQAGVLLDQRVRKEKIRTLVNHILAKYAGHFQDEDLLDEVTNLVEAPEALECHFAEQFLDLPAAVLEAAMKSHQRYFPIRDRNNKLLPRFIVITNGGRDKALIREGNERVLRARLSDARFFWEKDRKIRLDSRIESLKEMAYLGKLGSFYDKIPRLTNIGLFITMELNYRQEVQETVKRAAELAKTDLLTEMVGEFPELQGIMGYEYARLQGEPADVAQAIKEHYLPRTAGDEIPRSRAGIILSLAEKFDNIAACFSLGWEPTGSQDPYAIRRQALGVIRIIDENNLVVPSLRKIARFAVEEIGRTIKSLPGRDKITAASPAECVDKIMAFFKERLQNKYQDQLPYDLLQAVVSTGFDNLLLFRKRMETLVKLSKEASWPQLVEVVERTYNIQKGFKGGGTINEALLTEPEEKILWETYQKNHQPIQQWLDEQKYYEAARLYAEVFARPVHSFFEKVFVNVEDNAVRTNRVLLLQQINRLFSGAIADLSAITTGRA